MIKNEKQYRITTAQARRFEQALVELDRQKRPADIAPRPWKAQRDAAESQWQELREQIGAYERLHIGKSKEFVLEGVEDLPKTLIRSRIASGMTQEGLAHRVGVRTQQIQRLRSDGIRECQFCTHCRGRASTRLEDT